jgi:hypothetical protein
VQLPVLRMKDFYTKVARAYFLTATMLLFVFAIVLLAFAVWEAVGAIYDGLVLGILDSIGLVIIGFAVIETAKFIANMDQELRSAVHSRRSLTNFITIIVIAATLEALVMVFKTSRTDIPHTIFPAALLLASMVALVSLGVYQWLSSRIARPETEEHDSTRAVPMD